MMDSVNYYGSLCTEMYELLHSQAPQDELAFYLSYAHPGDRVLELLCGSGRFLVPFVQRGFDITGVDLSQEMLEKLLKMVRDDGQDRTFAYMKALLGLHEEY